MVETFGALRVDGGTPSVHFERTYDTSAEDLWSAISEPRRLARWFARVEGDLRAGGSFRIVFDEDDPDQRTQGRIQVCIPPRRLEVTWEFQAEADSIVAVELRPEGSGTRLVLDHRRLPEPAAAGYSAGWHIYLDALEADLRGGELPAWDQRYPVLLPAYREQAAKLPNSAAPASDLEG